MQRNRNNLTPITLEDYVNQNNVKKQGRRLIAGEKDKVP
jgi:hypothetical protein